MKVKGSIELEITATESERADVDKLVDGIKADPNLSWCKITVKRITTDGPAAGSREEKRKR